MDGPTLLPQTPAPSARSVPASLEISPLGLCCGVLLFLLLTLSQALPLRGDDAPADLGPSYDGILMLSTGRLVQGRVLRSGEEFVVRGRHGEMFVPSRMVRFQAKNLRDLYYKLRAAVPQENSGEHRVALAKWCMTQQLLPEAQGELKDLLAVDPGHTPARDLLRKVDELLDPKQPEPEKPAPKEIISRTARQAGVTSENLESLAGLSHEAGLQFVRRIQPILMNNCTTTGCHGPDIKTGLHFDRVSQGQDIHRGIAERNLSALLKYVDLQSPRDSRLLGVANTQHGRRGRHPFSGPRGTEQYQEFRQWVLSLDKSDTGKSDLAKKSPSRDNSLLAGKNSPKIIDPKRFDDPFKNSPTSNSPPIPVQDPFDPALFNSKSPK